MLAILAISTECGPFSLMQMAPHNTANSTSYIMFFQLTAFCAACSQPADPLYSSGEGNASYAPADSPYQSTLN